jgi:predicted nucleic acid-binding protein
MKFWDASAVVPLLVREAATDPVSTLAVADPIMLVWWGTPVECVSAIARLERDAAIDAGAASEALDRLRRLADGWHEVEAGEGVREAAIRFLRVHVLRAADALQLAAAFVAAERRPPQLELVTLDDRLAAAARKEGFVVLQPPILSVS